jgi:uncharacterized membrane protein
MTLSVSHRKLAEIRWTIGASGRQHGVMAFSAMPVGSASVPTFLYALGYPLGALAVSAMSPMVVLIFRFGLAAVILGTWVLLARVTWPTGRTLGHVLISGLLAQGVLFVCLYLALLHGAPAVLGAVVVSMNPVVTVALTAAFLGESLSIQRMVALLLGVGAVLAACAGRLVAVGGVDTAMWLLVAALAGIAVGGVYQQSSVHAVLCDPGRRRRVVVADLGPASRRRHRGRLGVRRNCVLAECASVKPASSARSSPRHRTGASRRCGP